jgi:hypothetical protein
VKVIHKYPLYIADSQTVYMRAGAVVLHVAQQQNDLMLWALVDPSAAFRAREIHVVGTGRPLPEGEMEYLGTVQIAEFVWHVFMGWLV